MAVRTLIWDQWFHVDDDDENWADAGVRSGRGSRPSDGIYNDDGEGEDEPQGGEKGTGKWKGTKDGIGKETGKATEDGKGKGNGYGDGIVKQTPGGDDISQAGDSQLQKRMYDADLDTEG